MSEQLDVRGAVRIVVHGKPVKLVPSFANLSRAESATGKTAVVLLANTMGGNVSVVDVAKVIVACGVPDDGENALPKPWNHLDVGQYMVDEGYAQYVSAVITLLGSALSAKPKKAANTEGGDASGES